MGAVMCEVHPRALLWTILVVATVVALSLGCAPVPAQLEQPRFSQWQASHSYSTIYRQCDEKGVCCYQWNYEFQCVFVGDKAVHESNYQIETPTVQGGARVLGQSLVRGPWESQ